MAHHFAERLSMRYGIDVNRTHVKKINESIQTNKGEYEVHFVKKKTNRISLWLVFIQNAWVLCYYSKSAHSVVTCVDNIYEEVL